MTEYEDYIYRKKKEYGKKFDSSDLDKRFIKYFNSGQRIKVTFEWGEESGTVGVTTGWKPVFLLIKTSRSHGSSTTLNKSVKKIEVPKYIRKSFKNVENFGGVFG